MNKTQKKKLCSDILKKYSLNTTITNVNEIKFLLKIFEGHDKWHIKKGCGISYISIGPALFKNKCFFIHRTDGSKTDISFHHAISNRSKKHQIALACREAIKPDVDKFIKQVKFNIDKCPFTGEILTLGNTHVDHYDLTFSELFELWLKNQNIEVLFKKLNETSDMNFVTYFTDVNLINNFREFHNKNTHLRAVSRYANTSLLRIKKITAENLDSILNKIMSEL